MFFRILIAAVVILGFFTGYQVVQAKQVYPAMARAPQGQAIGPVDAEIVMVEFMDYRCPACRAIDPVVHEALKQNPDVRVVYRFLPVFEEPSVNEARIALAAAKQGKFAEMHDILIKRSEPVPEGAEKLLAQQAGADPDVLASQMLDQDITDELLKTFDAARGYLNITATPTFLIGETIYTFQDRPPVVADFNRLFASLREQPSQ